jgi:hypothetical protein
MPNVSVKHFDVDAVENYDLSFAAAAAVAVVVVAASYSSDQQKELVHPLDCEILRQSPKLTVIFWLSVFD